MNRGLVAMCAFAVLAAGCGDKKAVEPDQTSAEGSAAVVNHESLLRPEDARGLAGSEAVAVGRPEATASVTRSSAERKLVDDFPCPDGAECFGEEGFYRAAKAQYPDIARVPFRPDDAMKSDPDTEAMYRNAFRDGLYFAKQIKLADGQSLFDLISRCSKGFTAVDGATLTTGAGTDRTPYWDMQFFPVFLQRGTGKDIEMQVLLERHGDTVSAKSPWFSANILKYDDFMRRHGIECWQSAGRE